MLHYAPQLVSSSTLLIMRRTNCITTASGIVTLCKQPYTVCRWRADRSPLYTCILVLFSPTLMMHGHMNRKYTLFLSDFNDT